VKPKKTKQRTENISLLESKDTEPYEMSRENGVFMNNRLQPAKDLPE